MPDEIFDMFGRKLEEPRESGQYRLIHSSDITPGAIQQRHIEPNAYLMFFGLSADRPNGSTHIKAYFATDTRVLSMWDGTQWRTTTLS